MESGIQNTNSGSTRAYGPGKFRVLEEHTPPAVSVNLSIDDNYLASGGGTPGTQ